MCLKSGKLQKHFHTKSDIIKKGEKDAMELPAFYKHDERFKVFACTCDRAEK